MHRPLRSAALHARTVQRVIRRGRAPLRERLGPLDERVVFVFGSPRSGTTFLGRSIGSLPGFIDLGEVAALKAAIPEVAALPSVEAAARVRSILVTTRRLGLVGSRRAVEQTPESAFVAEAVALAFARANLLHIVRDGRDVACSLLERGWLSGGRTGTDDAGLPFGAAPRFWVEPGRRAEFEGASDARRAAWAWRRYVSAARAAESRLAARGSGGGRRFFEVRYERMAAEPDAVAAEVAAFLDAPREPLTHALRRAHAESIGRHRAELTEAELADVLDESGDLLRELGYLRPGGGGGPTGRT